MAEMMTTRDPTLDWLARTSAAAAELLRELNAADWASGTLTIPPSLLKSECGMCHGRFEPSEMVARIPAGTDLRHACLSCWNDPGEWRQEERDRRKAEFYSRMGWR